MWLGSEFDDREEYAAEIEVGTAGWQHSAPADPDDELTRIAEDQGWDTNEIEAIRSLLEPPPMTRESEETEPEAPSASADEPAQGDEPAQAEERRAQPEPSANRPTDWPAADRSVTFTLPGGDELHRALEALGLPASSRAARAEAPERASAPERAEPHEWSKLHSPEPGAVARAPEAAPPRPTPFPGPSPLPSHGEAPNAEHPSSPTGEPEWLRGRRDPAARAFRRLRRIFPT
jgi:hypothetical protein